MELWPDVVDSVRCFIALRTQWRVGMAGATGLDYAAITGQFYRAMGIRKRRRPQIFADLQTLERAAMNAMNGQSKPGEE